MKKTLKALLLSFAAMLFVVSAYAQITTSSMSGIVTDQKGQALEGAVVTAVHTPSGTQYYAVVNADGRYSINGMRSGGPYTVTVSLLGYSNQEFKDVNLSLGETASIPAQLAESTMTLAESVIVAEGGLNASKTGAAQSINSRQITEMPSITRGIADVARMNPFIRTDNSGAMTFAGTNNRYNSFQIDGAMNNDVFGLTSNGSNGGQAGTQPVSMETIEQVQINVAPFDVRQSGFTGGSINAITKSGTNDFHASVYGFGNNQAFYGKRYANHDGSITERAMTQQRQYQAGVTVGGPIVKDKLFFFASFERSDNSYPNAYGLGSSVSKISKEDAEAVLAWAKGKGYKGDIPASVSNYTISNKATAKIDWNINNANHFSLRWSLVDAKQNNSTSTATNLNSSDYMYDFVSKTNSFVAELQSRISDSVSNEARVSYVRVRDKRVPLGEAFPMISVAVTGGTINLGNERSSEANRLDQDIWTIEDNLNWYVGNHTVTFGTHNEFYKFTNLFIQDKYGTYYFNTIGDLTAAKPNIAQYRYGHANTSIGLSENWEPTFHAGQLGFYVQDKWSIASNFDLTYGLRMDIPLFFDVPTENPSVTASTICKPLGVKTNSMPKSAPLFSPRVGFRWDIANDRQFILRGGVGLFTGRIPFVWFSNNFSNTGVQLVTVNEKKNTGVLSVITDPNGQGANETALGITSGSTSGQVVNVVDRNFKMAQNLRADLGFDFNVLGINWTAEAIFSKNLNDVAYQTLNYAKDGKTVASTLGQDFDNRPTFKKVGEFNNVYYMTNTNKGYSYNLMLQASKSFPFGLDLNASYTYSKALSAFNATSSVAASNFNYNYHHSDCNDPEMGNSAFNIPHQIKASVAYHISYGHADSWTTTLGLVYLGTSGAAYSVYYNGDLNGDSSSGNDLIWIPTDSQIDQMKFNPVRNSDKSIKTDVATQKANMKAWLAKERYLKDHRGQYYDRYADNLPFESHFDFHVGQKFSFHAGKQVHSIELTFDVVNVANLLNKNWGRSYGLGINQYYSPIVYGKDSVTNEYGYSFQQKADYTMFSTSDILSRWRGQIGLRYSF